MANLEIKNLHAEVEGKEILHGVNLSVSTGEVVAIMGPNGSGKSTLANAIMGNPKYKITKGQILLNGKEITKFPPYKRAKLGMFLGFQYPCAVPGVSVVNFLRSALNEIKGTSISVLEFYKVLYNKMLQLKIPQEFSQRFLNDGFSGGEKKQMEILQMSVLEPSIAILDEPDSGLDIDALKTVSAGINSLMGPNLGILLITHYTRILNYVQPQKVYVMHSGKIVKSGGPELAKELEEKGYAFAENLK